LAFLRFIFQPSGVHPKLAAGIAFNVAFYALLLFIPAGTLHWLRAWVFLAVTLAVMAVAIFSILPDSAGLFSQRAKGSSRRGSRSGTGFSSFWW
jgi:hypothetical protein